MCCWIIVGVVEILRWFALPEGDQWERLDPSALEKACGLCDWRRKGQALVILLKV